MYSSPMVEFIHIHFCNKFKLLNNNNWLDSKVATHSNDEANGQLRLADINLEQLPDALLAQVCTVIYSKSSLNLS